MSGSKDKLTRLLSLLQLEKEEEENRYLVNFKNTPIKERVHKELTIYPLKYYKKTFALGDAPMVSVISNISANISKFQPGSSVKLFCTDENDVFVKGLIDKIEDKSISITLFAKDHPDWIESDKLGLDLLHDEYTYKLAEYCLNKIINAQDTRLSEMREIIYGNLNPTKLESVFSIEENSLNNSQNQAIQLALSAKDFGIIHGPPGTGKTTTIIQLITELLKTEKRILVSAPSNVATDLLTHKLVSEKVNVTRIGNPVRISDEIIDCTLDKKITTHREYKDIKRIKSKSEELFRLAGKYKRSFGKEEYLKRKELYKESKELRKETQEIEKHLVYQTIKNSQVVTCTLAGAAHFALKEFEFDTSIIDEAGQAIEPFTLIPITKANRFILVGDPLQLPPTVLSPKADKGGLSVSLIEKLMQKESKFVSSLSIQYRMNDIIKDFSNKKFYNNTLNSDASVANKTLVGDDFSPLEFIDTAGCGFEEKKNEESGSITNRGEINVLHKHLLQLLENKIINEQLKIAIISPYKEQVNEIKNFSEINKLNIKNLRIHTIDSFQGQEADVLYISLVRSNSDGNVGFLKDYRRMNVAITRARLKLIVIGDSATIGNDNFFSDFLSYVEKKGGYRSAWEFN